MNIEYYTVDTVPNHILDINEALSHNRMIKKSREQYNSYLLYNRITFNDTHYPNQPQSQPIINLFLCYMNSTLITRQYDNNKYYYDKYM